MAVICAIRINERNHIGIVGGSIAFCKVGLSRYGFYKRLHGEKAGYLWWVLSGNYHDHSLIVAFSYFK